MSMINPNANPAINSTTTLTNSMTTSTKTISNNQVSIEMSSSSVSKTNIITAASGNAVINSNSARYAAVPRLSGDCENSV